MFNWLKEWFNPKMSCLDNLPPFTGSYPPMPKCKAPKNGLNISEPVYAIERSMIEHPSNWKVSKISDSTSQLGYTRVAEYEVKDLKRSLQYFGNQVNIIGLHGHISYDKSIYLAWATQEEKDYLWKAVSNMQDKKLARLKRLDQIVLNKQRQRLMEIYK